MIKKEFVLVHGAAHGAWCWEEVAARLRARGHHVVAPELPGHGRRAHERSRASVASYAAAVLDAMALEGVSRGIVVGHSMGGIVIPKVAEVAPARVAHLVFLAGVVLPDGGSMFEVHLSPSTRDLMAAMARGGGNGTIPFPAAFAWSRWMNDLPPGHPVVQAALPLLTPQPLRPFVERVDMKGFYAVSVPRTYIRCLKDVAVRPDRAAEYARCLGVKPVDLDVAHPSSAYYSRTAMARPGGWRGVQPPRGRAQWAPLVPSAARSAAFGRVGDGAGPTGAAPCDRPRPLHSTMARE
ncbi:MAG: alpha/beta fold hydrolase [Candidatus Rokubacteria bacterium]|nr:alpha/beta fold hydrolase [Candidatus Rokubacteria bacterium]